MSTLLSMLTSATAAHANPKAAALPAHLSSTGFADLLSRALPGTTGEEADEGCDKGGSDSEHAPHADLSARPDWSREWPGTHPGPEAPTPELSPTMDLQDAEADTEATTLSEVSESPETSLHQETTETAGEHVPPAGDAPDGSADERLGTKPEVSRSPAQQATQRSTTGQHTMTEPDPTTEVSEEVSGLQERSSQQRAPQEAAQQQEAPRPSALTSAPPEGQTVAMPAPSSLAPGSSLSADQSPAEAESRHPGPVTTLQTAAVQSSAVQLTPVQGVPAPQAPSLLAAGQLPAPAQPLNTQLASPIQHLLSSGEGVRTLTLKVAPEHVGPVTVRASFTPEGVRIELFAPQDTGREALRAMLGDLRRDLAGLGVSTGTSSLSVSDGQAPAHHTPQSQQGRSPEQQSGPPDPHAEQAPNQNRSGDDAHGGLPEEHDQLTDQPSRGTSQGLDLFA